MNRKRRNVVFSIVFLVFGFILAFSYSQLGQRSENSLLDLRYSKENELRKQLIGQQDENRRLQQELYDKQGKVVELEKDLSDEKTGMAKLASEAEKYRMFLGKVGVKGPGVEVKLDDGKNRSSENANLYIVHEHHVFNVINELLIAGADAVAVNGQRIYHHSYIVCNGPVITVDGNQYPAPFRITAIGNPDVLAGALSIQGGVRDQLVNDNVVFTLEKKKQVTMEPALGEAQ